MRVVGTRFEVAMALRPAAAPRSLQAASRMARATSLEMEI